MADNYQFWTIAEDYFDVGIGMNLSLTQRNLDSVWGDIPVSGIVFRGATPGDYWYSAVGYYQYPDTTVGAMEFWLTNPTPDPVTGVRSPFLIGALYKQESADPLSKIWWADFGGSSSSYQVNLKAADIIANTVTASTVTTDNLVLNSQWTVSSACVCQLKLNDNTTDAMGLHNGTLYSSVISSGNAYHKYTFNGNTNDTGSATARNLTNNGGATYAAGLLGTPASANCISLDGATQYLSYADNAAFEPGTGDFTICYWANGDETNIFKSYSTGDSDNRFGFNTYWDGHHHMQWWLGTATNFNVILPTHRTVWCFVWIRRTSGVVNIGGTLASVGVFSPTPISSFSNVESLGVNAKPFEIGRSHSDHYIYGAVKLDQFIFCKGYAFTDGELEALYNKGLGTEGMTNAPCSYTTGILSDCLKAPGTLI